MYVDYGNELKVFFENLLYKLDLRIIVKYIYMFALHIYFDRMLLDLLYHFQIYLYYLLLENILFLEFTGFWQIYCNYFCELYLLQKKLNFPVCL